MKLFYILLAVFMFIVLLFVFSCGRVMEFNVKADVTKLNGRTIKILGVPVIGYAGMHENIGIEFEIGGVNFVEQIRVLKTVSNKYKDGDRIDLRVVFSGKYYTIHCGAAEVIQIERKISDSQYEKIKYIYNGGKV